MKTALVHDWLVGLGGGEKVLQAINELYPAPIYTLVKDTLKLRGTFFSKSDIRSSFLQKFPFAPKYFRNLLPLFPFAAEQLNLSDFELILSSSHAVAKGIKKRSDQLHICYCHTPMRYAWDLNQEYIKDFKQPKKKFVEWTLNYLREWDRKTADGVDFFIANSLNVAERIKKNYAREAAVIYPPVNTHLFSIDPKREDYYITVSRLVPYKKIDLIVQAFSRMPDKRLLVIGNGPHLPIIKRMGSKNVDFLGEVEDGEMRKVLAKARAFIFAAEEDFGIVPVEAQAAGIPVIAYGKGGALETVIDQKTGLFFKEQTSDSFMSCVHAFERMETQFDPQYIKQHAENFNVERFKQQFKSFVDQKVNY